MYSQKQVDQIVKTQKLEYAKQLVASLCAGFTNPKDRKYIASCFKFSDTLMRNIIKASEPNNGTYIAPNNGSNFRDAPVKRRILAEIANYDDFTPKEIQQALVKHFKPNPPPSLSYIRKVVREDVVDIICYDT